MLPKESVEKFHKRIREFVQKELEPFSSEIEKSEVFPKKAHKAFAKAGFYLLALPEKYGGPQANALKLSTLVETIATTSPSAALLVFPTNAVLRTIALTGSEDQKTRIFNNLKSGDKLMAFCLTEPDHGSDAFNLTTKAIRKGDHYFVSGVKSYTTLGPNADYYLTFVRTGPNPKAGGISALLIPRDTKGLSFGPPERKMGLKGSVTTQMYMDEAKVPVANRLGPEGGGWKVLTKTSNPMRVWGAAALALGCAQGIFNEALKHLKTQNNADFSNQAQGFVLADMAMKLESTRAFIRHVCHMVDSNNHSEKKIETFTSMAKCLASDMSMELADQAGKILGPKMASAENKAAKFFCIAKGIQIFDGSNQIQRLIVARNLAAE